MAKKIILIGAGGHSRVIQDILLESGREVYGMLDDNATGEKIIGTIKDIEKYRDDYEFIIAIGNNKVRKKIVTEYKLDYTVAIHPKAIISQDVIIKEGTVIMAGAIINTGTRIGKHCIINTGVVVEHDNILENYSHVSPGAVLAGTVSIGDATWIGAGATIINNITILENVVIGSGSVVTKDIPANCTAVGVPARVIKINSINIREEL